MTIDPTILDQISPSKFILSIVFRSIYQLLSIMINKYWRWLCTIVGVTMIDRFDLSTTIKHESRLHDSPSLPMATIHQASDFRSMTRPMRLIEIWWGAAALPKGASPGIDKKMGIRKDIGINSYFCYLVIFVIAIPIASILSLYSMEPNNTNNRYKQK